MKHANLGWVSIFVRKRCFCLFVDFMPGRPLRTPPPLINYLGCPSLQTRVVLYFCVFSQETCLLVFNLLQPQNVLCFKQVQKHNFVFTFSATNSMLVRDAVISYMTHTSRVKPYCADPVTDKHTLWLKKRSVLHAKMPRSTKIYKLKHEYNKKTTS